MQPPFSTPTTSTTSVTSASPLPFSPFSPTPSDSHYTSDDQPDLGAFTTVLREWVHLQPYPRMPTWMAAAQSTTNGTTTGMGTGTSTGAGTTVWNQALIAEYLQASSISSVVGESDSDSDSDSDRTVEIEIEISDSGGTGTYTPSPPYSPSPLRTQPSLDDEVESTAESMSTMESLSLLSSLTDDLHLQTLDATTNFQPSLGYLDEALSFIAAERARWSAQRYCDRPLQGREELEEEVDEEGEWRHVIEPRRKRRRKRPSRHPHGMTASTMLIPSSDEALSITSSSSTLGSDMDKYVHDSTHKYVQQDEDRDRDEDEDNDPDYPPTPQNKPTPKPRSRSRSRSRYKTRSKSTPATPRQLEFPPRAPGNTSFLYDPYASTSSGVSVKYMSMSSDTPTSPSAVKPKNKRRRVRDKDKGKDNVTELLIGTPKGKDEEVHRARRKERPQIQILTHSRSTPTLRPSVSVDSQSIIPLRDKADAGPGSRLAADTDPDASGEGGGSGDPERGRLVRLARVLGAAFPEEGAKLGAVVKRLVEGRKGEEDAKATRDPKTSKAKAKRKAGGAEVATQTDGDAGTHTSTESGTRKRKRAGDGVDGDGDGEFLDPRGRPVKAGDPLVHVFIDHSNILFGLLTHLKRHPPSKSDSFGKGSTSQKAASTSTPISPQRTRKQNLKDQLRGENRDESHANPNHVKDDDGLRSKAGNELVKDKDDINSKGKGKPELKLKLKDEGPLSVSNSATGPKSPKPKSPESGSAGGRVGDDVRGDIDRKMKVDGGEKTTNIEVASKERSINVEKIDKPRRGARPLPPIPASAGSKAVVSAFDATSKSSLVPKSSLIPSNITPPPNTTPIPLPSFATARSSPHHLPQAHTTRTSSATPPGNTASKASVGHTPTTASSALSTTSTLPTSRHTTPSPRAQQKEVHQHGNISILKSVASAPATSTGAIHITTSIHGDSVEGETGSGPSVGKVDLGEGGALKDDGVVSERQGDGDETSPQQTKKSARHLSHTALALILERGRPITRRVLVTSSPLYQPMDTMERLGYEVRVYLRVPDLGDGMDRERHKSGNGPSHKRNESGGGGGNTGGWTNTSPKKKGAKGHARRISESTSTESAGASAGELGKGLARGIAPPSSFSLSSSVPSSTSMPTLPSSVSAVESSHLRQSFEQHQYQYQHQQHLHPTHHQHPQYQHPQHLSKPALRVDASAPAPRIKFREQGVDELLQLKLHQALAATDDVPEGATIVLATGDGNVGQFNEDGFLGPVRTALKRGWKVELYAWEEGLSRAWRREFGAGSQWASSGMFRIIGMEQFADSLVEGGP